VGSPITLSGFNDIDFSQILTLIMTQESRPLEALQSRQSALQTRSNTFNTLASKVSALQTAASRLSTTADLNAQAATSSNAANVTAEVGTGAQTGRYDVVVNSLARAQVTASATTAPDADSTVVASGGTLVLNGVTVTLSGAVTLRGLADAINATSNPPARASVIQSGPSSYRLVLSAIETGTANAFTITNNLTGGTGLSFGDADNDGVSGDSAADNAVQASDASLTVNNIAVTSTTNTIANAVPGVTLNLLREAPGTPIAIDVVNDASALKDRLRSFVTQYNDLLKFATDQGKSAANGDTASIGRDPLLRQLRDQIRSSVVSEYVTGGAYTSLSQVGVTLSRTGQMEFNEAAFSAAVANGTADVDRLFANGGTGVFASIDTGLDRYTQTDGLLKGVTKQLIDQSSRLSDQIASMQERLAVRRAALQKEFIAADQAMTQLKSQSSSLANFGVSV
jgi:flagellar hook-associated protein 2